MRVFVCSFVRSFVCSFVRLFTLYRVVSMLQRENDCSPFFHLGQLRKIRFMNYAGCQRKFKVQTFVGRYDGASKNAIDAEKRHGKGQAGPPKKKQRK